MIYGFFTLDCRQKAGSCVAAVSYLDYIYPSFIKFKITL
jgi:hypothetical protein